VGVYVNVYTKDGKTMDGEKYFNCAVELTDKHPGVQFAEMLTHDSRVSQLERLYFQDDWRDLPLYGYNTFCLKMENEGQKSWLAKIKELDSNVMLRHLESQLMQASRNGQSPNRAVLEATVKALQGVSAVSKIATESGVGGGSSVIEVRFIPSLDEPVEADKQLSADESEVVE